jgi:hypothetical protein
VEDAALHQGARQLQIIRVNVGFFGNAMSGGSLYAPLHRRMRMRSDEQKIYILLAAVHVGLDDRADAAGVSGLTMQATHEVEGALGVRRAFHVDADEVVDAHGVVHQLGDQAKCHLLADVEAHVGELEADVGVELALVDFVEHVVVELGAVLGFVGVGDVLAQVVDFWTRPSRRGRRSLHVAELKPQLWFQSRNGIACKQRRAQA